MITFFPMSFYCHDVVSAVSSLRCTVVVLRSCIFEFNRGFLRQDGIHYCASAVQVSTTGFAACNLFDEFSSYNWVGQCGIYHGLFPGIPDSGYGGCFNADTGAIQILYTQCTATQTAIVNSVQYTLYGCIATTFTYLFILVAKRSGFRGLFDQNNWTAVLNNKNFAQDVGIGDRSSIV